MKKRNEMLKRQTTNHATEPIREHPLVFCVWDAVRSGGRACGDQKDCETMCRKMRKKGKNGKIVQKSKERK